MKDKLKECMLEAIRANGGISDIRLSMRVMGFFGPMAFTFDEWSEAQQELLQLGEIFALKFTDPGSDRAKQLFFVKGTVFLNLGELNGQSANANQEADLVGKSRIDT